MHVEELVAAFRALGHQVVVVGPGFYDRAGFGGESFFVARLRRLLPPALAEFFELAYNIPAALRLWRACRRLRPDLLYERYNLFFLAGAWVARWQRIFFVLEVNAPLAEERAAHGRLALRRLARASERQVWRSARLVLTVTEVLRGRVIAEGVAPARVRVVPNGVAFERFAGLPAISNRIPVLGFVGFVREWHGLDGVIRAMAAHPAIECAFNVIGDGPALPALAGLAAALGVADRVRFAGLAPPDAVPALIAGFDIAVQPRVVAYASPLKIFDYMAAGRAIVAPDQPNIREILADGQTALLFDPDRPGALWEAVARLLADPALRARLGAAAREAIIARDYTWRGNAARIVGWAAELRGG